MLLNLNIQRLILIPLLLSGYFACATEISTILHNALESDHRVLSARAAYQAKQVEADGAYSVYLPVLRGTSSIGSSKNNEAFTVDGARRIYGLELKQAVPLFGRESARVALTHVEAKVEEAEVNRVEQMVMGEMLEALLNTQAAQETLMFRQHLLDNLKQQVIAAREAVAGGGMEATEVSLVQSRLAQAKALKAQASADLAIAKNQLARLLPGITSENFTMQDLRSWWSKPLTLEALQSAAIKNAPAVLKAQSEADKADAEYTVARSDVWPQLNVVLQGQRGRIGGTSANSSSVFIELNAPIYEGGASLTKVDSAAHRATAARENVAYAVRMADQGIVDAWTHWQAATAMALVWSESEQQEVRAIQLVKAQLTGGAATQITLLQAQQTQLETNLQGVEHRLQRNLAWVALMQQAGVLSLPDKPKSDMSN